MSPEPGPMETSVRDFEPLFISSYEINWWLRKKVIHHPSAQTTLFIPTQVGMLAS